MHLFGLDWGLWLTWTYYRDQRKTSTRSGPCSRVTRESTFLNWTCREQSIFSFCVCFDKNRRGMLSIASVQVTSYPRCLLSTCFSPENRNAAPFRIASILIRAIYKDYAVFRWCKFFATEGGWSQMKKKIHEKDSPTPATCDRQQRRHTTCTFKNCLKIWKGARIALQFAII
jgi:hypothetical protein